VGSIEFYLITLKYNITTPRRYPYFDVVVELAWSNDPGSYAGGSVATGRVFLTGQVKGDDPDLKGYPGPPGWWLGVRLTSSHRKNYCYETLKGGQDSYRVVEPIMLLMMPTTMLMIALPEQGLAK
jgi:hypothetical protein